MVIKYHISPTTLPDDMVVKIWEAQSDGPGAEVFTQAIPQAGGGGHPTPTTITANGLDAVVHIVRLFTATGANLLHEYNLEPEVDTVVVFDPIRFKIGDGNMYTPAEGTNEYTNPLLIGLTGEQYQVYRNNYGLLFPDMPDVMEPHYNVNDVDGSFQLALADDIFNAGEEFTILRKSQNVTITVNDSVVAKWFGGFVDINANMDYVNAHLRKLLRFKASVAYTFPLALAVPIGYAFCFNNSGNGTIGHINFLNGSLLRGAVPVNSIDIPNKTEACFIWDGSFWNVVYITSDALNDDPSGPVANTILGVGDKLLGDVPAAAWLWEVVHNLNIAGDYLVLVTIRNTLATAAADNVVTVTYRHHADKPNKFYLVTRELIGGSQVNNITVSWAIIKK